MLGKYKINVGVWILVDFIVIVGGFNLNVFKDIIIIKVDLLFLVNKIIFNME